MAFKLEDLINKKKEPTQILDLAKVKIKSKEDFEKYFDKIPEFKIRPEKVRLQKNFFSDGADDPAMHIITHITITLMIFLRYDLKTLKFVTMISHFFQRKKK